MLVRTEAADRDGAFIRLALADDEQQRNLGQAMLANLVIDLLVAEVGLGAQSRRPEPTNHLFGIIVGVRNDRRDHRLDWREP